MAITEIQTRIQLKYDSYVAWTTAPGKDLVLLKGEIGICEIPSGNSEATTAPTVLFKVGDGTSKFSELQWASAKAADVYSWAKAETVELYEEVITDTDGKETGRKQYLRFRTGTGENSVKHTVDLSSFATDAEVQAITTELAARISAIEGKFSGDSSVEGQISAINDKIGTGFDSTNTVAKAITDTNAKFGYEYSESNTVAAAIADAKQAGIDAQGAVAALTKDGGAVAQNTAAISGITNTTIPGLEDRLDNIEAFFEAADHDGEDGGLTDALDTLKEIQEYLNGEGSATDGLLGRVSANEDNIKGLQDIVKDGGTLEIRVDKNEGSISNIEAIVINGENSNVKLRENITALQTLTVTGNDANTKLRSDINDLQTLTGDASKGNEKLRADLNTLNEIVTKDKTGLVDKVAEHDGKISAIEGDYLKATDAYIFNCGTATTVTHTN